MIWCVDHDAQRRNLEIHALRCVGMDAKGYDSADSFWKDLQKECPELILMDAALPGVDPLVLIKRIRQSRVAGSIPVIMQAQSSNELDVIRCLDSGADDCLGNPFGMMEMVSRVKAVLRRAYKDEKTDIVAVGKLTLNPQTHTVRADGEKVILTLKEFELLHKFMRHPGRVYSREQLLSDIWGADYVGETRTVDVHIGTLRTKLGECGEYIDTVRGVGYRLEEKNNG